MYIRCWGSRGSIPVSGKGYVRYGGDTTCLEIRSKNGDLIIVDGGTGIRPLGNKLIREKQKKITMLFTHAHWDHLMGFPFFKPLFTRGTAIVIRSRPLCRPSVRALFDGLMARPYFPVQLGDRDIRARLEFRDIPKKPFRIGPVTVRTIPLSHPKDGGCGFRFEEDGKAFVFLTDNELGYVHPGGCAFDEYKSFARGADLLIHDAEYDEREYRTIIETSAEPWGHSSVSDVLRLGGEAGVKKLGLFHLNAMRTDDLVDGMVAAANRRMAKKKERLRCFAVGASFEITL